MGNYSSYPGTGKPLQVVKQENMKKFFLVLTQGQKGAKAAPKPAACEQRDSRFSSEPSFTPHFKTLGG